MNPKDQRLRQIWHQERIPVVFREGNSRPLLVHLPYSTNNKVWLKADHRNNPEWIKQYNCLESAKKLV